MKNKRQYIYEKAQAFYMKNREFLSNPICDISRYYKVDNHVVLDDCEQNEIKVSLNFKSKRLPERKLFWRFVSAFKDKRDPKGFHTEVTKKNNVKLKINGKKSNPNNHRLRVILT